MHNNEYVKNFMAYYNYPEEAVKVLTEAEEKLDTDKELAGIFDGLMTAFRKGLITFRQVDTALEDIDGKYGIDYRTLAFVFIMNASEWVKELYAVKGLPEKAFLDIFADLKWKLRECMECEHTVGTFVAGWFCRHLSVEIFCCGRFQYELSEYNHDEPYIGPDGIVIKKGDPILGLHIPSSGISLTDDVRLDSYKQAYEFFRDRFPDGIMKIECGSWLLYEKHREFLPKHLNILKFMDDFDIVSCDESDEFHDDWRVFGPYTDDPIETWPEDSSLRRAYKKHILSGGKTGSGCGIILFDGEKIINKR